ncbi:MAG: hypothetical protein ACON3Z_04660 [Bradymonadia bacterium]
MQYQKQWVGMKQHHRPKRAHRLDGLNQRLFILGLVAWAGFGCIEMPRLPDFRDVDHAFDMQPEACLLGLSFDEIVGQPCLTEPTQALADQELGALVGCVHIRRDDYFEAHPVQMAVDRNGERVIRPVRDFEVEVVGVDEDVSNEFVFQWILLDSPTPDACTALQLTSTCENTAGCYLAVGPSVELPGGVVNGRNIAGDCQYNTPDGIGLVHPEMCDGRDNDCDGVVDNAPECMENPEIDPVLQPPCVDSVDCDENTPLCIDGICRACWPDVLECDSPRQPFCTDAGLCRGCQNDAECPNGATCSETGACIECSADTDCPDTRPFCRADGACDGCDPTLGDTCPEGQACLGDGTCGQCVDNDMCPESAPVCNQETNLCEGCGSESDCPNGYRCFENLCRECVPTGSLSDCPSPNAPICDAETLTCRVCLTDDECGDFSYCYQGACRGCSPTTNLGCEDIGRICDPNGFSCGECTLDDQCAEFFPDAPFCNLESGVCGACVPGTNRGCLEGSPICVEAENGAVCQPCTDDASCAGMDGAVCDEGRCVACADNDDCDGQVCATVSGSRVCAECDPEATLGETGCPEERPQCSGTGVCVQCDTNEHCTRDEPICDGNICRPCGADAECAYNDRVCASGRCRVCDGSRANPDDPSIDFACTPEFPNCTIGDVRCSR